jgi:hypothetical protein
LEKEIRQITLKISLAKLKVGGLPMLAIQRRNQKAQRIGLKLRNLLEKQMLREFDLS